MRATLPTRGLELHSKISKDGRLELSLVEVDVATPADDQVLVRVEAAPINPSDLALILGPIDRTTLAAAGTAERPVITARVPPALLGTVAARFEQSIRPGNEGAGTVIAGAPALVGKRVALRGGMYAQYRVAKASECLVLPEGTTAAQGASAFVNPMTVASMLETMRRENHKALVHTAAASNLGQMLVRACAADGVALVNIVRSGSQVELLRSLGAEHVLDSSAESFESDLVETIAKTGATLAFDAIGGGTMASRILSAMESAAARSLTAYSRYGTNVHKKVYVYGRLDTRPIEIDMTNVGFAWDVGGWLLPNFLEGAGLEVALRVRNRVLAELTTTFASKYTAEIPLERMLDLDTLRAYTRMATGEKFLVTPNV